HLITGLMIRDYILDAAVQSPMAFAERYYVSYPRVAFGMWPPLFHVLEGAWVLVLPPSRTSAMLLMALITALLALLICSFARRLGDGTGLIAAVLFLTSPIGSEGAAFLNIDMLVALFCFAAAWYFGAFLESSDWRDSLKFGLISSAAL